MDNKLKKNLNATFTPEGPKPTENGPAPQHWCSSEYGIMDLQYYSRFISFISLHFSAAGLPPEAAAERPDGQGGQHCSAGERDEEQQPGGRQTQAGRVCSSYRYHSCRCIVPVSGSSH